FTTKGVDGLIGRGLPRNLIKLTGSNTGSTYSITGGDNYPNLSYGTTHTSTKQFPIADGDISLTLTDDSNSACALENVTVSAPATCSSKPVQTDVQLTKNVTPATAKRGDTVVYTLTITNQSDTTATGVSVTDLLPAGVEYVSDDGLGTYDAATGVWSAGSLAANTTKTLKITATVR
ncbi:MAG: DUF11 domain-containing protein, partial [Thiothrix sp.]